MTRAAMTNFRGIDMLNATDNPGGIAPEDTEAIEAPVDEEEDNDKVPNGSAAEVLDWVAGDKARAAQALAHERASASPRKGLSNDLKEISQK